MPEDPPPSTWKGVWRRFLIGSVLIVALSGATTATVALNKVTDIANEVFPKINRIVVPKSVVTPEYSGGPRTFLILGSDRRVGSKDAYDREDPPHSDTILLVRFDPKQGQTSVLSIPRDLMVNIKTPDGYYPDEKINAAYTIGNKIGGVREGMLLAAEQVKQVLPGLQLNGIIDVSFAGFIRVVDKLGCAYVNVDHHYFNENIGTPETDYTSINLQPGYQKLCYENALDYVRYRHYDSDFVRVARQQDFIRDLREEISPTNEIGQIDGVSKSVGHAIITTFKANAKELIQLAKLIVFSQSKPLRQVKFRTSNIDFQFHSGSYVTSTPELELQTLEDFLHGDEKVVLPATRSAHSKHTKSHHRHHTSPSASPASLDLYPTSSSGESEAINAAIEVPFRVLYPTLQTGPATQQQVRAYTLKDPQKHLHHAYVIVWQQNSQGGYYDLEGTDWLHPPLFAHARTEQIDGRSYMLIDDGAHIHVVGWREGKALYWVTNTLLEELSNSQMIAIARSAGTLR